MRKVIPPRDHSAPMRARTPERVPRDDDDRTERAAEKESFLRDVSLDNYGSSSSPSPSSSSSARANTPRPARAALAIPTDRETERKARQAVRWKDLPRKGQLTVLTLARLSEPLVQTSIQVRFPPRRQTVGKGGDRVATPPRRPPSSSRTDTAAGTEEEHPTRRTG